MPRANRYIQPGSLYHLTHRCHDRKFLFRFAVTRSEYQKRLRAALKRHRVPLLNYCITCNHTHLLLGLRQRYRLIDRDAVLRWQGGATWQEFARDYEQAMEAAAEGGPIRNPIWTESIAVGSPGFTKRVLDGIRNRVRLQYEEVEPGVWTVREPDGRYGLSGDFEGAKTASKGHF